MKALILKKYWSPKEFKIVNIKTPKQKDDEVLIKIKSIPITTEDPLLREWKPYFTRLFLWVFKPKKAILWAEFSWEIVKLWKDVHSLKVGDQVYGHAWEQLGCYAEYICMKESWVIDIRPNNLSQKEASPVCSFIATWNFIVHIGKVWKGTKVLINWASWSVGSIAIQISKYFWAEVTGVSSKKNISIMKKLWADITLDYKKDNLYEKNTTYDIIFDTSNTLGFWAAKSILTTNWIYINPVFSMKTIFFMLWTQYFSGKKCIFSATGLLGVKKRRDFLKQISKVVESQKIKILINKVFTFQDIALAHYYVENKKKNGNVIITMD